MKSNRVTGVLLLAVFAALPLFAQTTDLGKIDFPTSTASPEAQQQFLRGVLLLHSFEYEDAREAFQGAQKAGPGFALAYWGEAMTYNHPLWREQDFDAAQAALARLGATPEARLTKAPTEREKGYLRAVEVLYGKGEKVARDAAYAETMRELHERFPDDLEAASFYALAILGTAEGERVVATYMKAASVAEEVFARNPQHPGAAHYLIHSYDDPVHAPLGLRAARVYARIAPAASHAQHMVSHIYVALGDWDEVITSNQKAVATSEDRLRRKGQPLSHRNHHALHWLEYAYLQEGRFREARQALEVMESDARADANPGSLWYFAAMRAAYIVAAPDRKDAPASLDTSTAALTAVAADQFATGLAALRAGDSKAAQQALEQIRTRRASAQGTARGHHTDSYAMNTDRDLALASIMQKQLEALLRLHEGRSSEALKLMEEAVAAEDGLPVDFGPPDAVKATHELLGETLLQLGRAKDAQEQFELALERAPRRSLALLGLARACARAGDTEVTARAYSELRQIWQKADAGLAELDEVNRKATGGGTN